MIGEAWLNGVVATAKPRKALLGPSTIHHGPEVPESPSAVYTTASTRPRRFALRRPV